MQMKHDTSIDLRLDQTLEIKCVFERRKKVAALINTGANITSPQLEKILATYDFALIDNVLAQASKLGLKPTTECLNIMIENRAAVSEKAYAEAMVIGSLHDPYYSLYALQARTVKTLIELGALVTPELVQKSVMDDHSFGEHNIAVALDGKNLESTSMTLQSAFNRISEIRKNSRVLAQAFRTRTSLFSTLPEELLHRIASLKGKTEDAIEENESDIEIAANAFSKPN
ncbi:hypothetical protein OQJ19_03505 [Fluoribacter gormanii]|uniref:hypothetical protein n=1 Tax=Fluoribacter gormanii TaxID=464 RepID=UPI002244D631|nr:hypothetical protein [Fluoribacter gormanii]MCW8469724.1 hypothetical protein [Fluoribacter gormanii]